MKIFYWAPFNSRTGVVDKVLNSILAIKKYGNSNINITLLNATGEWNDSADQSKLINVNILNIGTEKEMTIEDYAKLIMNKLNIKLKINYVNRNLNGTPRKILDCSLARRFGWKSSYSLDEGLQITISDFIKNFNKYK